jgi:inosine-uridine nucleoside N-ribohydrolase
MARKVILVTDPGIDGAFAVALALSEPELDVVGVVASAGNVGAEQATRNVQTLVEQMDPARWPRVGAALAVEYDVDAVNLHGPGGLGGVDFPCAQLHHQHPGDKLIGDLLRTHPKEVSILLMAPATMLARTLDRDPEVLHLVQRVVMLGGTWHEPGDVRPVSEFHFFCDPPAARQVLRSGMPITLLPLDVTKQIVFSPSDLLQMPVDGSPICRFLRQIVPHGLRTTSSLYGTEGIYLQDVLAPLALLRPELLTTRSVYADVEIRGELTRGMSVIDVRWGCPHRPNVELATRVDAAAVQQSLKRILWGETGETAAETST